MPCEYFPKDGRCCGSPVCQNYQIDDKTYNEACQHDSTNCDFRLKGRMLELLERELLTPEIFLGGFI